MSNQLQEIRQGLRFYNLSADIDGFTEQDATKLMASNGGIPMSGEKEIFFTQEKIDALKKVLDPQSEAGELISSNEHEFLKGIFSPTFLSEAYGWRRPDRVNRLKIAVETDRNEMNYREAALDALIKMNSPKTRRFTTGVTETLLSISEEVSPQHLKSKALLALKQGALADIEWAKENDSPEVVTTLTSLAYGVFIDQDIQNKAHDALITKANNGNREALQSLNFTYPNTLGTLKTLSKNGDKRATDILIENARSHQSALDYLVISATTQGQIEPLIKLVCGNTGRLPTAKTTAFEALVALAHANHTPSIEGLGTIALFAKFETYQSYSESLRAKAKDQLIELAKRGDSTAREQLRIIVRDPNNNLQDLELFL